MEKVDITVSVVFWYMPNMWCCYHDFCCFCEYFVLNISIHTVTPNSVPQIQYNTYGLWYILYLEAKYSLKKQKKNICQQPALHTVLYCM